MFYCYIGHFKSGCSFRLEEYVLVLSISEKCGSLFAQRDSLRSYNIYLRGHAFGPARLAFTYALYCPFIILQGWNILTLRGAITIIFIYIHLAPISRVEEDVMILNNHSTRCIVGN